jgi:hypothetical protein
MSGKNKYSSPNGNTNAFSNRNSSPKVESSWPDTTKQFKPNTSPETVRKNQNNKYANNRNQPNKFLNKTGQFTSYTKTNESGYCGEQHQPDLQRDLNQNDSVSNATVPNAQNGGLHIMQQNSFIVPSLSAEQSINDSALPSDDSIILNGQDDCVVVTATMTDHLSSASTQAKSQTKTLAQSHTNTEMLNIDTSSSSTHDISPLASLPTLINAYASSSNSSSNESFNKMECCTPNNFSDSQYKIYNTTNHQHQQQQQQQQQFNCSPYMNELNCNTNAYYEYDYTGNNQVTNSSVPMISQQQPQQASPFYVYHHHNQQQQFTDYASPNSLGPMGSPPHPHSQFGSSSANTNNGTSSTATNGNFYQSYPNATASYMPYDPSSVAPLQQQNSYSNMLYSPMQSTAPGCSPLTSPQQNQSASLLASYQTPPQPQHHHQLYISAGSTSTGDSSTAPNSSSSTGTSSASSSSSPTEQTAANSPQMHHHQQQQQQQHMYSPNPYMVYPPNSYLTPQAYHSPVPTSSSPYMMYSQPAQALVQTATAPLLTPNFTTPTSINTQNNNNYKYMNNRQNRFNYNNNGNNQNQKNSFNNYNGKKSNNYHQNHNNKFNNSLSLDQTPQLINYNHFLMNSPLSATSNMTPVTPTPTTVNSANVSCCDDTTNTNTNNGTSINTNTATTATDLLHTHQHNLNDQSTQNSFSYAAPPPPNTCAPHMGNPYEYYDPNTLVQMGINPMTYDYGHSAITTYGEDVYDDNYDDNSNLENENDEQLACYVCRGRRMCFCYFLKVRYYKFPSFFDLVDHQYKKWRQTMIKNKKAAAAPLC